MREYALTIPCEGSDMLSIVHPPSSGQRARVGIVIVVGGAQYRIGSHRMFVTIARALASEGFAVMRFDRRGMGDSAGPDPGFENSCADIEAAILGLKGTVSELEEIYLLGLCDGATAAAMCAFDSLVSGHILINPWVRSPQTQSQSMVGHYYRTRIFERDFWLKLVSGRVNFLSSFLEYMQHWRRNRSGYSGMSLMQSRLLSGLQRSAAVLVVLAAEDITSKEFRALTASGPWADWVGGESVQLKLIEHANHTFSGKDALDDLIRVCADWLKGACKK